MTYKWMAAAAVSLLLLCPFSSQAAQNTLNLPGIGKMTVPQRITFEKGQQEAIPFMADGGIKKFFTHKACLLYTSPSPRD